MARGEPPVDDALTPEGANPGRGDCGTVVAHAGGHRPRSFPWTPPHDTTPTLARTRHIVRQVCAALAEVYGKGMVHRDVKPDNVMLTERGGEYDFVKLLDFGIVKR